MEPYGFQETFSSIPYNSSERWVDTPFCERELSPKRGEVMGQGGPAGLNRRTLFF